MDPGRRDCTVLENVASCSLCYLGHVHICYFLQILCKCQMALARAGKETDPISRIRETRDLSIASNMWEVVFQVHRPQKMAS